MFRIFLIVM